MLLWQGLYPILKSALGRQIIYLEVVSPPFCIAVLVLPCKIRC